MWTDEFGPAGLRDRRRPAGDQRVELGARTGERGAVGEATDQVEIVAGAVLPIRGIENQRIPELDVLIGDVEMRRHDADDSPADAVHLHRRSDDRRAGAEHRLPQLVRQNRRRRTVRTRLLDLEGASIHRVHAERPEQVVRRLHRVDAARPIGRSQVGLAARERADAGERARPLLEFHEFGRRYPELVESLLGKLARNVDQAIGLRISERSEDHRVDHGKDRGVGTDAERQREDGDNCEAWRAQQIAYGVARVPQQGVHDCD